MFYFESVGECVSQVYEVAANSWEEAKKIAWNLMAEGDILAECDEDAIEDDFNGEYHRINKDMATNCAELIKGAWVTNPDDPDGPDNWLDDVWYWSDDPEELLSSKGEPYEV